MFYKQVQDSIVCAISKDMMSLNNDIITDILGLVDGVTLASAGCVSSQFWSMAKEEKIWEDKCSSLWPSTEDSEVKKFISSSLGGFRNFYASCFPVIACDESSHERNKMKKVCESLPTDFVSLVDITYKDKTIYSKVVWGIPCAEEEFDTWLSNCPFKMEIINYYDVEDEDQAIGDELPKIDIPEDVKKDWKFVRQLTEDIRLSWIMVNKRTGRAANLSSWSHLSEKSHRASHTEFAICFGSILSAHNDQIHFCASYQKHLNERGKTKQTNIRNIEGRPDVVGIFSGIVAAVSFGYIFLRASGVIMGL